MFDASETAAIDKVLTTTRSVRRRLEFDHEVDIAVVVDCLRIATYAPNARNEQDWRWIVVTDRVQRNELSAIIGRTAGRPGRQTGRAVDPAIAASASHLRRRLAQVPVLVFACMLGVLPENPSHRELSDFYGSILPAVWSFQLALHSRGLGSVMTTQFLSGEGEICRLLSIPSEVTPIAMIPVARLQGDMTMAPRRAVHEVIYADYWGQRLTVLL